MKDSLGLECAGVIIRKGSDVTSLEIGDQVFTMGAGSYVTKKVLPAKHVHRILDGMTMEEAATMPVVYGTAVHAIINLGQLKKGQVRHSTFTSITAIGNAKTKNCSLSSSTQLLVELGKRLLIYARYMVQRFTSPSGMRTRRISSWKNIKSQRRGFSTRATTHLWIAS